MKTVLETFAAAVREMRHAQMVYFKLRQEKAGPEEYGPALKEARKREREVDGWLVAMERQKDQTAMFE